MTKKKGLRKVDFYNRFKLKDFSNYITNEWCTDDWRMTELVDFTNCHEGKFPKSTTEGHWNMFENYKDMFNDEEEYIEIQRNDLAEQFNCVPSQINYVISTRFRPSQGYYVESRRGGRRTYHNKKS